MPEVIKNQVLHTIPEARALLRVETRKIYELIDKGFLAAICIGGGRKRMIRRVSIMRFLADYDGYDLSDLDNIKPIVSKKETTLAATSAVSGNERNPKHV